MRDQHKVFAVWWLAQPMSIYHEPPENIAWAAWKIASAQAAQPVAEIRVENNYWNRGHFFEGTRPALFALADLSKYPLGTKLFAA